MNTARVLVCGGRDFDNVAFVWHELARLDDEVRITHVIHGGCRGVDVHAGLWARHEKREEDVFRADWQKYGKKAGPIRNERMLVHGRPDMVLAFPGGRGTRDMVNRARKLGVAVRLVQLARSAQVSR